MTDVAVLLAAGGGTRLRPLTYDRPKALIEVGSETILHRAVRLLVEVGVRELVVATGYRSEAVRAAFAGFPAAVTYCHNAAFDRTQNSISLLRCAEAVRGRAFFKLDGDVLFRREVLERLGGDAASIAVAVEKRDDLGEEEMKVIAEGSRIARFGKKLDPSKCVGESIGIERLSATGGDRLFAALAIAEREGHTDLYYEDVYSRLIEEGTDARLVDVTDLPWIEIDTADDLARARARMNAGELDRPA